LGERGKAVKAKSSQVPDMFLKEFSITPHFYPVCFDKHCPPFTYIAGPKGRNSILKIEPSIWGATIISFFLSHGSIKLAHCKKKIELGRHLI